jgi:hypothetical protein
MPGDYLPDDLKILWKEVGVNPPMFSADQLRKEMERLQAGRHKRYVTGIVAAWILFAAFTLFFFVFENTLARIGSILSILGAGYWLAQLQRGRARIVPDVSETDGVRFYRAELERLRDCHRGPRLWSRVLIFAPPWILFNVGFAQIHPELAPFMLFDCAAILAAFAILVPLNLRLAGKYQRRIDALDAVLKENGESNK